MTIPADAIIICEHAGWTITEEQHQDGDRFPRAWRVAIGPNGERVLPALSGLCGYGAEDLRHLIDMGFPQPPRINGVGGNWMPGQIGEAWEQWMQDGRVAA